MSYEIIEKNKYGVLVKNNSDFNDCCLCRFTVNNCKSVCFPNEGYYLTDKEAAKLETEITPETFTINDLYVESKLLFDCQDKLNDLQIENKKLKDRIKELESMVLTGFVCIGDEDNCPSYMEGKKGCDGCEFWK